MENASKALLIAGGMLLLILVLTFGVYLFTKIGSRTANLYEGIEQSDIDEFNQQFFNYDEKDNLTIQDVVSIINLAKNSNENGKFPVTVSVKLITDKGEENDIQTKEKEEILEFLSEGLESEKELYTCKVHYAESSHANLVGSIVITKK